MFREGRQVKINTSVYEQIRYFFRRNFMENRLKIHKKSGKTGIRNKNRQKCCPWGSLFGIESILGQFLDSGGNPKIIQNLRGLLNQVVSGAIWKQLCAFERLLMDFGSILGPFWAPPKPILVQFGGISSSSSSSSPSPSSSSSSPSSSSSRSPWFTFQPRPGGMRAALK